MVNDSHAKINCVDDYDGALSIALKLTFFRQLPWISFSSFSFYRHWTGTSSGTPSGQFWQPFKRFNVYVNKLNFCRLDLIMEKHGELKEGEIYF